MTGKFPVTVVSTGNEPLKMIYLGQIVQIDKSKCRGRVQLEDVDIASFEFGRAAACVDAGKDKPCFGAFDSQIASTCGIGASIRCLLGVDRDNRLLVTKLTTEVEWRRVKRLITERQEAARMSANLQALRQMYGQPEQDAPNRPHGLRPCDLEQRERFGCS